MNRHTGRLHPGNPAGGGAEPRRAPRLPPLVAGGRRALFAGLVSLAVGCGLLGVAVALLVGSLVSGAPVPATAAGILGLILLLGYCRYLERVLAEKLGQHYVAQLRVALVSHSLLAVKRPSVGITVARASNDLSSVRNWVAQGIAPLLAGIPLLVVAGFGLWMLHPGLALALGIPVLFLACALGVLAKPAYERARTLRRHRGNLAARIADTVVAGGAVVAAGGVAREVSRVRASGGKVMDAAVDRARLAAVLRALALGVPLLATAVVVLVARHAALDAAHIATALTLLGLCAAPVGEWGRIVEYRQNYRAARRIIAPLLHEEAVLSADPGLPAGASGASGGRGAHTGRRGRAARVAHAEHQAALADAEVRAGQVSGVRVEGFEFRGTKIPELRAEPGERILLSGADARLRGELLAALATARTADAVLPGDPGQAGHQRRHHLVVAGRIPGVLAEKHRRNLVGAAFGSMVPERGSVLRALRYRRPRAEPAEALGLARRLGLEVRALPQGENTQLRRGGMPLSNAQRAGLLVARAMLGSPALLLLDDIDSQLDDTARERLAGMLAEYPGVVIVSSPAPWCSGYRQWKLPETSVPPVAGVTGVPGLPSGPGIAAAVR